MAETELLTVAEIARRLGVSVYTAKARIRESGIHGPRAGREMRFTEDDYWLLIEKLRERQYGCPISAPSTKDMLRAMRARRTRRLGSHKPPGPVVDLNLKRPKGD